MAIVTRTFFEKSNTIIKDCKTNLGLNPILELCYGNTLSRGLIYFDHTKVKGLLEDKTYPDIDKLHHVLKMNNTSSLTNVPFYKYCGEVLTDNIKERAVSFDLIFFLIPKEWDSGNGFDYVKDQHVGSHSNYTQKGCNWYKSREYFKWDDDGVYDTKYLLNELERWKNKTEDIETPIIGVQHFERGNENIEIDITDVFNKFITDKLKNYGIGIAFAPIYEKQETKLTQYVGFFTQHTNSFFEPYIETRYNEVIEDDRTNFYLDKDNKLYFNASVGGFNVNLDEPPTCTIEGQEMTVKQASKGLYYVELNLSSKDYEKDVMLYDVWGNLKYNNIDLPDVDLSFVTKANLNYFSFGLPNEKEEIRMIPSVYGINHKEEVQQGDVRKIQVDCRIPYTTNQSYIVDDMQYRLYVLVGDRQFDVITWTKVEHLYLNNYFLINTSELVPSRYYIDIKIRSGLETIQHPKILEFDIVNNVTNSKR